MTEDEFDPLPADMMRARRRTAGLVHVEFDWSDEHGECTDCGRPAAFLNSIDGRLCAVCAANAAADGDIIRWIVSPWEDADVLAAG